MSRTTRRRGGAPTNANKQPEMPTQMPSQPPTLGGNKRRRRGSRKTRSMRKSRRN
jgi:hypothetical protein